MRKRSSTGNSMPKRHHFQTTFHRWSSGSGIVPKTENETGARLHTRSTLTKSRPDWKRQAVNRRKVRGIQPIRRRHHKGNPAPARTFLPVLMPPLPSRHSTIDGAMGLLVSPVTNEYCRTGSAGEGGAAIVTVIPDGNSVKLARAGGRSAAASQSNISSKPVSIRIDISLLKSSGKPRRAIGCNQSVSA